MHISGRTFQVFPPAADRIVLLEHKGSMSNQHIIDLSGSCRWK